MNTTENTLEKQEDVIKPSAELLYHYCFNIENEKLEQYGVKKENIKHFKAVLMTTLADKIARELKDNWLIVHDKNSHVLVYGETINENKIKDEIVSYYNKTEKIPEDTLYLGENGLEFLSKSVDKIEKHKLRLEFLIASIEEILPSLANIENSSNKNSEKEDLEIEEIIAYLDSLPYPNNNINSNNNTAKNTAKKVIM